MVRQSYVGLGTPAEAVAAFAQLRPYAAALLALRAECSARDPAGLALDIALDGLRTCAYHFTRRRDFYHELEPPSGPGAGVSRLADRTSAIAAFEALTPHVNQMRRLMTRCRPFGQDYLALMIAKNSLETAAFHLTGVAAFYGARGDSAGPTREAF